MRTLLLPILAAANAFPAGASAQSAPDAHVLRRERGDVIEIREVPVPAATNCPGSAGKGVGASVSGKGTKAPHHPRKTVPSKPR